MSTPVRIGVALAVLLMALAAHAAIIEEIVANVNGDIITMTEVQQREFELESTIRQQLSGDQLDRALEEFRNTLLVDMINEKLLFQRAMRLGLDLEQVYQSSLESIMAQNNIQTKEELLALLEQQGMSVQEFRDNLLKYNIPDIMINLEVRRKISASDEEMRAYYEANVDSFAIPETYTFREIAFLIGEHGKEECMRLAREVIQKVAEGDDFMGLVRTYSEAASRDQAGLVENLHVEEASPQILEALRHLESGQVSEPVEMSRAVMVLKLESKQDPTGEPFEQVKPQLEAAVKRGKFDAELKAYFKNMWEESHIRVIQKYQDDYSIDLYQ